MAWSWNAQNAQQDANCSLGRMEPRPDPMASETQNCTFQCFLCWQWHIVLASAFYVVLLDWHLIARHCMHNPPVVSGVKLWWKEGLINVSATGWGITWWLGSPVATRFSTQGRLVCGWSEVAWHCDLPWGTCRDDSLFTSAFFDSSAPRFVVLMIWSKSCTFEYPHTATRHTPATCFGRKGDTWVLSATTCYHYRSLDMSLFAVALSLQPSSRPRDVDWAPRGHFVTPHIHFGAQLLTTIPYNTIQYHKDPQSTFRCIRHGCECVPRQVVSSNALFFSEGHTAVAMKAAAPSAFAKFAGDGPLCKWKPEIYTQDDSIFDRHSDKWLLQSAMRQTTSLT